MTDVLFFPAVDPMETSMLTPRYEPKEPRQVSHKFRRGRMLTEVYWFYLRLQQNKALEFWQTITKAIISYDSMLAVW